MSDFNQQLALRLREREAQNLYRRRKELESAQGPEIVIGGKKVLSFCSNDYLGLANHPDVISAFKKGLDQFGAGSGASHLITGHSSPHHALEEELADFTGRDRALVFSSGYAANLGIITTLLGKQDSVFEDRLNHVSLLEGGLFSGANFKRYPHLQSANLAELLAKNNSSGRSLIVSDGVFSMDGDVAPLAELTKLARDNNAVLMVDDAHGFGCLGSKGGGLVEQVLESGNAINQDNLQVLLGTMGKAFGTSGAFVCGSEELIETLIQFCRPYIYTTAMPPAIAAASRKSLKIIQEQHWRRESLQGHVKKFRAACSQLGFTLTDSQTPIQAIIVGSAGRAVEASQQLERNNIIVSAIRPPTVPEGSARLRITFTAEHTEAQLDMLLSALEKITAVINSGEEKAS